MTLIIILAVVGIFLVLAELVLPGGIVGIGGVICLLIAVVLTFMNYGAAAGFISFVALLLGGFLIFSVWAKNFSRLPFTRRLVLQKSLDDKSEEQRLDALVGKEGLSLTVIAPSGHADINGDKVDVMTESGKIEKGKAVRIVQVRGPSIIVEQI